MLRRNYIVHAISIISNDDVIDEVIIQILTVKFCDLTYKIVKIGANLSKIITLNLTKSDFSRVKFSTKKFSIFFNVKRYPKYKAKIIKIRFSYDVTKSRDDVLMSGSV